MINNLFTIGLFTFFNVKILSWKITRSFSSISLNKHKKSKSVQYFSQFHLKLGISRYFEWKSTILKCNFPVSRRDSIRDMEQTYFFIFRKFYEVTGNKRENGFFVFIEKKIEFKDFICMKLWLLLKVRLHFQLKKIIFGNIIFIIFTY